jgi:hypothetical protein
MKTIENKKTTVNYSKTIIDSRGFNLIEKEESFDYKTLIIECINAPQQGGYDIKEMALRIKILNILKLSNDLIQLEDAEFEKVKSLAIGHRWGIISQELVDFVKYIEGGGNIS